MFWEAHGPPPPRRSPEGTLFVPRHTDPPNPQNSPRIRAVETLSGAAQPRMHGQLPVKGTREARSRAMFPAVRRSPGRNGIRNPRRSHAKGPCQGTMPRCRRPKAR